MSSVRSDQTEYIWFLQLRNKGLERRLESFESGRAYVNLREKYETELRRVEAVVKDLRHQLTASHEQIKKNRECWFEVFEDMEEEQGKRIDGFLKEIKVLKERNLEVERQRDEALDKLKQLREEYYKLGTELEEERGKNLKLTVQVNMDFQNSSIPSSGQGPGRKKIPNSREKTGRKRGGQTGHKGHRLKQKTATSSVHLPDPEEYLNDPDYYPTKNVVRRQKIILSVGVTVQEYTATVFRNRKTGSRVHAAFPEGYETDVSYDGSVKALAFILANEGNMSAGKIRSVLREVTDGMLDLSEATINGLCKELSEKSKEEREALIKDLMTSPVMNADFTNANVNGETKQVLVLASPINGVTLYVGRDYKGHKGVLGTPLENYVGTLVHDHDKTFYSYGLRHQECLQHNIRYLKGSIENEPDMKWNVQMLDLHREMLHYMNGLSDNDETDPDVISGFESRYDQILQLAKEEYEYDPPSDYYRDGYNLYLRLGEYKEHELLFLHDRQVPSNNSRAERDARFYKRKQKQMIVLRSRDNFNYLCDSLSLISTFRHQDDSSLYDRTKSIFSRKRNRKPRFIPGITAKADVTE